MYNSTVMCYSSESESRKWRYMYEVHIHTRVCMCVCVKMPTFSPFCMEAVGKC